jgi:7-cyano-7-deazaguanine synthase in queuosine biosynthesis
MIETNLYSNNICLLFSGGIDSALIFYLVAKDIQEKYPNKTLTLYVIDRYNRPLIHAYRVHDLLCKKLNNDSFKLNTIEIPPSENFEEIKILSKIIKSQNIHDMLLCGINKYPDDITIRPKFIADFTETDFVKYPLKNYTKDAIINQFYKLGIEDILPYTHSCGLNNDTPCEQCFNCRERIWAYDRLNLTIDLGI